MVKEIHRLDNSIDHAYNVLLRLHGFILKVMITVQHTVWQASCSQSAASLSPCCCPYACICSMRILPWKQKTEVDVVRNVSRYVFAGFISRTHTGATAPAPHRDFFCFRLGAACQFVNGEAKVGDSPSATAVTELEEDVGFFSHE